MHLYSFNPKQGIRAVGLVTHCPAQRRLVSSYFINLVPLILLGIFAFVTIFLLGLKYYPNQAFADVKNLDHIGLQQQRNADSFNPGSAYPSINNENQMDRNTADILASVASSPVSTLWKQPTLLNLTNFMWLANNESRCLQSGTSPRKLVPVLVHTARSHFENRKAIRDSWASVQDLYKNWDVRPVFLLGQASPEARINEVEQNSILAEQQLFGDLVMGNFVDVYRNLGYKHLMGYKWILNFCPNATFVIKVDDDFFLDIFNWLDWRTQDLRKESIRGYLPSTLPDFYCLTFSGTPPIRDSTSKYYISYDEWPEKNYPDYCSGTAYGITVEAIRKIYSVTKVQKFVWIDDAYVTGILRRHLEKQFGWKPVIKDIWTHFSDEEKAWLPLCESQSTGLANWMQQRKFKSVVLLPKDNKLSRNSYCLWVKLLFDKYINKVVNNLTTKGLAAMLNGTLV